MLKKPARFMLIAQVSVDPFLAQAPALSKGE
jgi:hypothetical protein